MKPKEIEHKQDMIVLGVVFGMLTLLTVVSVVRSQSGSGVGAGDEPRAVILVARAAPPAADAPASQKPAAANAASGKAAAERAPSAGGAEHGTWVPQGDDLALPANVALEEIEIDLAELELESFDVVLPGGLILPRLASELLRRSPRGLRGLAVHDRSGRIYYATEDEGWTTLWARDGEALRTVWCGETGARHFEIAGLSGDEILVVETGAARFSARREPWVQGTGFHALRISQPGLGPYPIRLSRRLIDTVLAYCD